MSAGGGRLQPSVQVLEGGSLRDDWAAMNWCPDEEGLARHVLFLGAVGSGKTTAIQHVADRLRRGRQPGDVFVFFDPKGDYRRAFAEDGDAAIGPGAGQVWNVFSELIEPDGAARADYVHEIASTLFGDQIASSGQNRFFAYAARDVFAAVLLAMAGKQGAGYSNADLRRRLAEPAEDLAGFLAERDDPTGAARYLETPASSSVLAFLQQTAGSVFSGRFREEGDFSLRRFIRGKGGRALFIEYDLAVGARLLPVYRVLIEMAIKEALDLGRTALGNARPGAGHPTGRVFFVLDEFALLPALSHLGDGVNFGRQLGLRFIAGAQNVHQVFAAYGPDIGRSIVSGFGTVVAFRLLDAASREAVRQRFGANRKQVTFPAATRTDRDQHEIVAGNVIEDWDLSTLGLGQCLIAPHEGLPFRCDFQKFRQFA